MKIKTKEMPYEEVIRLPHARHLLPLKPSIVFRTLMRVLSQADLRRSQFHYTVEPGLDLGAGPYLILMNHSSFIDLKIVSAILYPKPYGIVCTSDGFVGKSWLMRHLGCIPTEKFVTDVTLIRDMKYMLTKRNCSVLMYPEASYTFDGCATPLPRKLGGLFKLLDVPVVMIHTDGAFTHDPLYGGLRTWRVKVSATVRLLFSREDVEGLPVEALDTKLDEAFRFDGFRWQKEQNVRVEEPFRADGLERLLYKCASCGCEGQMKGSGTRLTCAACGKTYEMDPLGELHALSGATEFPHIPDWYHWERDCVRRELEDGTYRLDTPVRIGMMVDRKAIYLVGNGRLVHDRNGFVLDGCDGKLHYEQKPLASYGLYADYYWYELGDMICIGTRERLYYCFPSQDGVVAKTRLAAEELYKMGKKSRGAAPRSSFFCLLLTIVARFPVCFCAVVMKK